MPTCLSFARAEPVLCGECGGLCAARPLSAAAPHAAHWEFFPGQSLTLSRELCCWDLGAREKPQPRGPGCSRDMGRERTEQWRGRGRRVLCPAAQTPLGQVQNRRKQMSNLLQFI